MTKEDIENIAAKIAHEGGLEGVFDWGGTFVFEGTPLQKNAEVLYATFMEFREKLDDWFEENGVDSAEF